MSTVLAADPGSRFGAAIVSNGILVFSACWGLYNTGERDGVRFWRLFHRLAEVVDVHGPVDVVAVETKGTHGASAKNLKASFGYIACIKAWAEQQGVTDVREVYPPTLKKAATGNGRADKAQMIRAASVRTGRPVKDDNEADAICLAFAVSDEIRKENAEW